MKKIFFTLLLLPHTLMLFSQTLQSPQEFLGYKIGTHFTPDYKIVNYFNAVAQAKPDMVKVEKYGETYEGRELILAYIASPENLQKLDVIRMNNLRMAGMAKDKMAPITEGAPAIVWLSYNVHGNEASSSEAAMLVLYALVDPNNTQTKEWLKNTVVIMDPCINPDGHDRYVNWYNTAVGDSFNVDRDSREHDEPWPYGRTNHYNFDLNRDWAWQTQKETQERIKKYNEWLPQVHVDYHEQGYNAPYYFAPATEPFHEVITPWQRQFQTEIGKNNAKYFDANGWLYFTKETYDLLYPSYGDTYPTFNGAIGMTYEQGGGGTAGLAVKTNDGDTLTLAKRAIHHYTTSISTIEITSKNAAKVVSEFKKYFDDNRNAAGSDTKTYVLTSKDANRLQSVANLLQANGIEYGTTTATNFKAYNYFTGKEENYSGETYQLAISAYQPKSRFAKVLFEPKSFLSDSATYDITAWAVPYAFGIRAYAVKEKLDIVPYKSAPAVTPVESDYGMLVPYTSFNGAKFLCYLLQHKVKVRYSEKPFTYKEKNYDRGTLIILKGSNNPDWKKITNDACKQFNVQADEVESGFVEKGADFGSEYIRFIKAPRVAMLTGDEAYSESAGEVWCFFEQTLHYPITQVISKSLEDIGLNNFDVLIIPNGMYNSLDNKPVEEVLQNFVKNGGKIIALENGAAEIASMDWGFKLKEQIDTATKSSADYSRLKKFADRERDVLPNSIPGAIYKVELDNTHPLAYGYPDFYYTLKQDGKLYDFLKSGWNVGVVKQSNYISGFVGSKLKPQLKDGLLLGVQEYGKGNVIILADDVLFRLFWENGKLLFSNAIFLVGQ
ncbi:MAG TPA: M14 family metallopeptidase [Chitinophagaceae bacterium]|jgi:hypothetical protein